MVVVDTLRADHLSVHGYERPTSPYLEEFARDAVLFESARSQAGCTFPSANSILTSRYPHHFLRQPDKRLGIPEEIVSLPEILQRAGYATAAVSASPIVRRNPTKFNEHGGYDRGFDRFDEVCLSRAAGCVNKRAGLALAELPEPFFLYLHYMEPHATYQPPERHRRRFATGYRGKDWVEAGDPRPIKRMLYRDGPEVEVLPEDVAHLTALYDEEILYFDWRFRQFVSSLDRQGLLERTLIVLLSDHGEELLDHSHIGHCRQLAFDTVLRTPLLMRIPGGPRGVRRRTPVQNLDVVPTVLDYLGLSNDRLGLEGATLRPVIEADRPVRLYQFASQGRLRMVTDGRYKLILDLKSGDQQLFFLAIDPDETVDLAERHPKIVAEQREALRRWLDGVEGPDGTEESLRLAREREAQLEAVGYL